MPPSKLSPLQEQVLIALSGLQPAWTLTGGAALAGFHTKHRETRDLDLFFHHERTLGSLVADATHALQAADMTVTALRTTPTFAQLDVRLGTESVVVDLVADPTPIAEAAQPFAVGTATILVETPHQLLVNKLCALLSRSELRDLVDVRVLIESGLALTRALADCPGQDAGFSPLTFAWSARALPIRRVAAAQGWSNTDIDALEQFRDDLVVRVLAESQPDNPM
ncbi:MAG TPA: nucleotidyl transferase AbiEii/AbiGii toxin family protein [Kofleriaceae bacterium]